ncbi:peptidoglycan-binding protein [Leuconostoc mesenteroides subsp. dextranicum]|jgi:murein DD-endopeptidase MepM/ murein hydrolase activator NlpD|uniref:LysM peptidoglycan-binding domain-containing protein n=1 Tax=Leuconostoc TaxID=1243 RepID=UPI00067FB404|nr:MULTISPECIES: LysM domain-containing protein [Leuconostoc]KMY81354.1 peptidoglycan-binding protein [Leuconostoc mesenteroides subsp. dextranicum]MBZ1502814.1 LysM peptidoglycan-binding domain-containing protein [Leuconostoc mesenteroides]MCH3953259.1 LysM peptidoglycan-binding domain-containing protein [Leuconostoc mesenteroides]MCH3978981.1 LysM peptidoglycan-binding domain-containing protein [Leuconostoc mesenteroides]MCI1689096.1 LysM peptidoglycan-binding domain-containing protein [Leuc
MFNIKKTLTIAAGVAGALAFGGAHASADTTDYVVQSGDTLNKISAKYNVSVDKIAAQNNISNVNWIVTGQHLSFATDDTTSTQTASTTTAAADTSSTTQAASTTSSTDNTASTSTQTASTTTAATSSTTTSSSSSSETAALNALIARESSGNVNATNGQYYGLGQLSAQARSIYGGNTADYNDQLNAMKAYIATRYGTAVNALAHSNSTGWY